MLNVDPGSPVSWRYCSNERIQYAAWCHHVNGDFAGNSTPPVGNEGKRMSTQWYYQVMGEELGPCSTTELRHLAQRKAIEPDTLVRKGNSPWIMASRVKGLLQVDQPTKTVVNEAARTSHNTLQEKALGSVGSEGAGEVDLHNAAPTRDQPATPQPERSLTSNPGGLHKYLSLKHVVSVFACVALLASLIVAVWPAGPAQRFQTAFAVVSNFNMRPGSSETDGVGDAFDLLYEVHEKEAASNITHSAVIHGKRSSSRPAVVYGVTEFELHYQYPDQSGGSGWQLLLEKSMVQTKSLSGPVSLADMVAVNSNARRRDEPPPAWVSKWMARYVMIGKR